MTRRTAYLLAAHIFVGACLAIGIVFGGAAIGFVIGSLQARL